MAAILNLKVKTGPDPKADIIYEFFDPENPRNAILIYHLSQTIEKVIFNMADGGHFGFLPTVTYAHTFERDTLFYFPV